MYVGIHIQMQLVLFVWFMLMPGKVRTSASCSGHTTIQYIDGFFCPSEADYFVSGRTTRRQCIIIAQHKQRHAISYNAVEQICILAQSCPVLQPNRAFTTQLQLPARNPDTQCINWTPFVGKVPDRSVQDASRRMVVVAARFYRDRFLLPAKYEIGTNRFYSVQNRTAVEKLPRVETELLEVDHSCTTKWVAYNGLGHDSVPNGAIGAGHKPDGTVLYFVRIWIAIYSEYSYGYYDPQTGQGYCHLYGSKSSDEFDFLCVVWDMIA